MAQQQLVMKTDVVQAWAIQPADEGDNTAIVFRVQGGAAAFSFCLMTLPAFLKQLFCKHAS